VPYPVRQQALPLVLCASIALMATGLSGFGDRHRADIKVQDGCLLRCSFCIIPHVRPNLASRPMEDIVAEAKRLIGNGYKEIVLTGIHLGHYGVEWNRGRAKDEWIRLATLVERLAALSGEFRIRLSSIEATEVTRELIRVMAEHPDKVCPHLHISMQSGSDTVLRRMRRRSSSTKPCDNAFTKDAGRRADCSGRCSTRPWNWGCAPCGRTGSAIFSVGQPPLRRYCATRDEDRIGRCDFSLFCGFLVGKPLQEALFRETTLFPRCPSFNLSLSIPLAKSAGGP